MKNDFPSLATVEKVARTQIRKTAYEAMKSHVRTTHAVKEKKIEDSKKELGDLVKEEVHFHHKLNLVNAVSTVFDGRGNKAVCFVCEQSDIVMSNMPDGQWYCQAHKGLWTATPQERREELRKEGMRC